MRQNLPAYLVCLAWLVPVALPGCRSEPVTYDMTSEETLRASYFGMIAQTVKQEGHDQAKELEHAFAIITEDFMMNAPQRGRGGRRESRLERMQNYCGQLHGLTAPEIVAHAKTLPNWISRSEAEEYDRQILEEMEGTGRR